MVAEVIAGPLGPLAGHIGAGGEPADPADPASEIAFILADTALLSIQVSLLSHHPQAAALAQDLQVVKDAQAAPPHFPTL